jgi:hypothetical protein
VVWWPLLCAATVVIVFLAGVALTSLLARTPLAVPLTGRQRQPWATRAPSSTAGPANDSVVNGRRPEPVAAGHAGATDRVQDLRASTSIAADQAPVEQREPGARHDGKLWLRQPPNRWRALLRPASTRSVT